MWTIAKSFLDISGGIVFKQSSYKKMYLKNSCKLWGDKREKKQKSELKNICKQREASCSFPKSKEMEF